MMDGWLLAVAAGSSVALASGAHCLVMCGPLAVASRARAGNAGAVQYALGRLCTYTLLGSLAGSLGHVLYSVRWARWSEAALSWLLGVALLLVALRVWGRRSAPQLVKLGKGPRSNRIGRALSRLADEPLLLGAATALLPCGALFSAVMAAAALGSAAQGALAMAVFATLTGFVLGSAAQLARLIKLGSWGRRSIAVLLVAGALIMFVRPLSTLGSEQPPHCHGAGAQPQEGH